jgi:alpha-tubulin suppressor-like RCC1 family protein
MIEGYTEFFSHGCDENGQLGHAQQKDNRETKFDVPKSLSFDILISKVSCGGNHTLMLAQNGDMFSIGSNEYGQLGLNDRQMDFTTAPLLIQSQ